MPPSKRVSRDEIEEAAFHLVRTEGLDALTARRIAEQLGVSTQPVYTACTSMTELQEAVHTRVHIFVRSFLAKGDDNTPPFLQVGYQTLLLARDEPALFRIVSEGLHQRGIDEPPNEVLEAMRADPRLLVLSKKELLRVHAALWVFTQGLAASISPKSSSDAMKRAREQLRFVGEAVIEHAQREHKANASKAKR